MDDAQQFEASARAAMVARQLRARGITDESVLAAMGRVPRERFVPEALASRAYEDSALPIGEGQTISQPYMVARTCELARIGDAVSVLEVGGGSGYQAAVVAELTSGPVVSVEIVPSLAARAAAALAPLYGDRVRLVSDDGLAVARREGPFDRILVAAGAEHLPDALVDALAPDGILVVPVGPRDVQRLLRVRRTRDGRREVERFDACVFVPLLE